MPGFSDMSLPLFPHAWRSRVSRGLDTLRRGRHACACWVLLLLLLAPLGSASADLRTTLSPFLESSRATAAEADAESVTPPEPAPQPEPPMVEFGGRELALYSPRLLAELYAERDFAPAWDTRRAQGMLALAQQSRADGFEPADFHAEAIAAILDNGDLASASPARRDAAELLLSDALLRYVHHFRFGKLNPEHVNRGQTFVKPADAEQLKADMANALAEPDMAAALRATLPNPDFYRNLKLGYQRYLAIADRGGWQDIPAGPNLRVGAKDRRVPLVREHLEARTASRRAMSPRPRSTTKIWPKQSRASSAAPASAPTAS